MIGLLSPLRFNTGLSLVQQIGAYRADYNHVRPHEAIAWNRPAEVHVGLTNPPSPTSQPKKPCNNLTRDTLTSNGGHEGCFSHA